MTTPRFRSLLAPLDLTPGSDRILGRVALLPLADDARVTILHVVPGSLPPRERREAERYATKLLATEAHHLRQSLPRKASIRTLVRRGAPAGEIAACAAHTKSELVVMGRGGGRALRDAFLGSTAERVIRQSRLPVLVVRLPARTPYARPALALDLDEAAHDVVRLLLRVLPPPRPPVTVVHAFDYPYARSVYTTLSEEETEERRQEFKVQATGKLTGLLAAALAGAKDAPRWKTHVRFGSPRLVVKKAVKKADTDVLLLGTHGYPAPSRVFLGTVAGDLLREVRCDVLVVPPASTRA